MKVLLLLALASIAGSSLAASGVTTTTLTKSGSATTGSEGSDPVMVWFTESRVGLSVAQAAAHMGQGSLQVRATSDFGASDYGRASATFIDTITFQVGTSIPPPARFWYSFNASISPDYGLSPNGYSFASLRVQIGSTSQTFAMSNFQSGCSPIYTDCAVYPSGTNAGNTHNRVGGIEWAINPGPVRIVMVLHASAFGLGESVDAFHTGRMYLEVPPGVTFTSESGVFLQDAAPIPEVGTGAMIGIGFLVVLMAHRRRYQTTASFRKRSNSLSYGSESRLGAS